MTKAEDLLKQSLHELIYLKKDKTMGTLIGCTNATAVH